MATIAPQIIQGTVNGKRYLTYKWPNVGSGDTITPALIAGYTDKTVYFLKGSSFGGNMSLTVSPDTAASPAAASFLTAQDQGGTNIASISADAVKTVLTHGNWALPAAAATVTGVTVWLVCASTKPS